MATFTVRPEGIIRQPALTMPGNATGSEAACTSLTASQIRTLLSLGTTSDVTFDIVRATTSVLTPLVNNASAALTLGNSTYGVTVPGAAVVSGDISMAKTSAQGYIRAYNTAGVKNVAMYHNGTDGYVVSSAASLVLGAVNNISISNPVFHYGNVQIQAGMGSNLIIGNQAGGYPYLQLTATNGGFLQAGVDKDSALSNQLYMVLTGSNNLSLRSGTGHVMLNPGNSLIPIMGATSSYPALKRSSTTLAVRLGDDSADAPISCAGITASGVVSHGAYTVATLPAAGSNAGKMAQVTDSNVAASGNYGATVAAGGANRVKVFSDGTNWVIA